MRVWLVDDRRGDDPGSLEALLSQLANRVDSGFRLLGAKPFGQDFVGEMRVQQPDILVVNEPAWPDNSTVFETLTFDPSLIVATTAERSARFRTLAERHAVWFVPPTPGLEGLRLALLSAAVGQQRQAQWRLQMNRLQQRLNDRIVIERAKGVMVQRLGISEEEAYKRLRLQSRRQRRQIRDIAQSLLDTQLLLLPEGNGFLDAANGDLGRSSGKPETPPHP
jgi:response regulator NasT